MEKEIRETIKFILSESPLPIILGLLLVAGGVYVMERRSAEFDAQKVAVDLTQRVSSAEVIPMVKTLGKHIPNDYRKLIAEKKWKLIVGRVESDSLLDDSERKWILLIAHYHLGNYDSVLAIYAAIVRSEEEVPTDVCLYHAFARYRQDPEAGVASLSQCVENESDVGVHLKAVHFLIKNYEGEAAQALLRKVDSFVTSKYRPHWHYYMALALAMDGSRDAAIDHLMQAINYKPDWIRPRMKLAELLPNTEEGLRKKVDVLEEVLRLQPTYAPARYMLAMIRRREQGVFSGEMDPPMPAVDMLDPEALFHRVRAEMAAGNVALAKKYLDDLLAIDPGDPHTLFLLGNWYRQVDSLHRALEWYRKALHQAHGRFPEAWLNTGITYRRLGHTDSALYAYQQALRYRKDYHEALYNLGVAYWYADSLLKAKQIFEKLARITPDHDRTWFFLGRLFERMNKMDSAVWAYRKALAINPAYRKALLRLARIDKGPETVAALEQFARQNPRDVKVLKLLGDIHKSQKNLDKSLAYYQAVLRHTPDNVPVLRSVARIYEQQGRVQEALALWQEILDRRPDDRTARRRLAALYLALADTGEAIQQLEKLLRIRPHDVSVWEQLIELYDRKGWVIRPTNRLREVWSDTLPEAPRWAYEVATFARKAKRHSVAIRFYRKAWEGGYRPHWSAFWMARAYLNKDDTSKAIHYFALAAREKPDFGLAWKRLAHLYAATDSLQKAQDALRKAKALRPNDPDILKIEQTIKNN